MLHHHPLSEKDEKRISNLFSTLAIGQLLRNAGIKKSFGMPALAVFQLIFSLVFQGRNWFRLLEGERGSSLPGKDVVYRFLNHSHFHWRRFLHSLSLKVIPFFESLTSASRIKVLIIDDSVISRNRSKKAELLALCKFGRNNNSKIKQGGRVIPAFDHCTGLNSFRGILRI